ncbi:MAG TPA: PsbP-related protein [Syntrophomonadaceae bacterium]|nr:PsbP-related protein [Syntrophomonadaceae bacterium]
MINSKVSSRIPALRIWALLAMFIMVLYLAGCSSNPPAKEEIKPSTQNIEATKDYQTYTDATNAFTMKYPADWKQEKQDGTLVAFSSPDMENVNVVSEDLSQHSISLADYVKASLSQIEKGVKNYKLISSTTTTMGSIAAQKIVYTGNMENMDLQFMQVMTIVNKKAYVFTYTSLPANYDKHSGTVQTMIDSFSI